MAVILQEFHDFFSQIWVEVLFVVCCAIGFAFLQLTASSKKFAKSANKLRHQFKIVHAQVDAGNVAGTVTAWRAVSAQQAASCETLKLVANAYLESEPSSLVAELGEHLSAHASKFYDSKAALAVLEVIARAGKHEIMDDFCHTITSHLHIPLSFALQEILLGGYASAGQQEKVTKLVEQLRTDQTQVTVRGYSLMIKGFLKNGMLDAAVTQIKAMLGQGLNVPPFAISEVFRVARDDRRTADIFYSTCEEMSITADAATIILEDCLAVQDMALAKTVEKCVRQAKVHMNFGAYEALLKLYTSAGDLCAFEVFEAMQKQFSYISDGLCVRLISGCAEPKFVRFAEVVVAFVRSRSKMTIVMYSALMKVYSYCGLYNQACDLYDQLRADGLEPDSVMYGCLMKFSAECGRTDLTKDLFAKAPVGVEIHHYMALIRAACQDKDVETAFVILDKLKASGSQLDTMVCNSVLDVCSSAGDMTRARSLVDDMRKQGLLDQISYNTLLKGYAFCGDSRRAEQVMAEMTEVGLPPNDVSYNCLINMAASSGDFNTAWKTIETMECNGVPIDHYTVATMMKAVKRTQMSRDALGKVMALLDRRGIDVCKEEVLLNTALEACIKHGEHRRLEWIVARVESQNAGMQLATHTYATLIRASAMLKRVSRCRELWTEMTEVRRLEPNGVALGCMLDALVCSGGVVEGVSLLRKWQNRVPVNTVLYSTLIKGFANIRDNQGAEEIWCELCAKDLPLNSMVYNAIVDAHARVGAMDKVTALVGSMEATGCAPDDITWSMVAKGYCMTGELDKALEVFRSLPDKQNANRVVIYNTILDGCVCHSRNDVADLLLQNMEKWNIVPSNFTLGIVVKMWGRRRNLDSAFAALKTLPTKHGFTANGPVKTCLLFACLRNDAVDLALDVFDDIRASGHATDAKLFTALINNCARVGKCDRAVALVEDAYGLAGKASRAIASREELEPTCLEQLVKSLSKQGLMQKVAAPLLKKMRAAKVPVSTRVMTMVF